MPSVNRYQAAFKESGNMLGIASALALSAAFLTPVPLLVGLVLEAAYMLVIPDSKWFTRRLSKQFDAEIEAHRQKIKDQILPQLRPELQARFQRLEETRRQIGARPADEERWFREILRKLDYLLEKFLLFADKERQFRAHLHYLMEEVERGNKPRPYTPPRQGDPAWSKKREKENGRRSQPPAQAFDLSTFQSNRRVSEMIAEVQAYFNREIESLREEMETEDDYDTKAVLEKRLDVLQQRYDSVSKIGKILTNLDHQLQLLEDTFGLINDEIRARPPEQLMSDVEEVVVASNTMTSALEELAPIEQMVQRLSRGE